MTGLNAQSKTGQVLGLEAGRALDRLALVDVRDDRLDLVGRVAELAQGARDGLVDDLEVALADQLLVLDEGDVGLDAGGVAIHHERDRAGGREHADLCVAIAVLATELERLVPGLPCRGQQVRRTRVSSAGIWYAASRCFAITRMNELLVLGVLDERAAVVARDDRADWR